MVVLRAFIYRILLLIDAGICDPETSLSEPLAQPRQHVERVENPGSGPQNVSELLVSFRLRSFFKHTAEKSKKVSHVRPVFLVALLCATLLLSSTTAIHSTTLYIYYLI